MRKAVSSSRNDRLGVRSMIPIKGKSHDLGDGFIVTRMLPQAARRSVGPFVFFDYFGPVDFPPGKGVDVRPHPHIGLATVTYLFEGAQMHRDTLGSVQEIKPGDVNWMTAGRGIAHSERTGAETARRAAIACTASRPGWGCPKATRKPHPHFQHFAAADLPERERQGRAAAHDHGRGLRPALAGQGVFAHLLCRCALRAGRQLSLSRPSMKSARSSSSKARSRSAAAITAWKRMAPAPCWCWKRTRIVTLFADSPARVMLFGGAPLDGPRHIWWNFVSSSKERIEQAKQDWRDGAVRHYPRRRQGIHPAARGQESMNMKAAIILLAGIVILAFGMLFTLQGAGWCIGRRKAS